MAVEISLDQLTPQTPPIRKIVGTAVWITLIVVLAATWIWTGINPYKLYEKRSNAWSYLFGKDLSAEDVREAREQAERFPELIAYQEAMNTLRKEAPDTRMMDRQKLARDMADKRLTEMTADERDDIVNDELKRILSDKRGGFFPPASSPGQLKRYIVALLETIAIAIWGSLIAIIAAIPFSMLAARNTLKILFPGSSPALDMLRAACHFTARRILDFCRGFNEFVMALIFVAVIGLGPFAGILALAIHTFGILGKVISEAMEAIDPGQVEAVDAGGAAPLQVMGFAVMPQVMPIIVSYSLLRFEANVRSATILGFVGAGGIGFLMYDKLNGYLYREVCTMMIMVIVSVTIIDYFCGLLRNRFI